MRFATAEERAELLLRYGTRSDSDAHNVCLLVEAFDKAEIDLNRWLGLHRGQVMDLRKALQDLAFAELPSEYKSARDAAIKVLEETNP